jgi:UDP-N-acetylmuramate dehydrogenase
MDTLRKFVEKINARTGFTGRIGFDEPMSRHTSFKTGGPADLWIQPEGDYFPAYAALLRESTREEGIPLFVLGAGANLVVADRGIRGVVLDTGGWSGCDFAEDRAVTENGGGEVRGAVSIRSGTAVDAAAEAAAVRGWGGLEFLAGMPGSLGGAVWMNARCYEKSVSDCLLETEILDEAQNRINVPLKAEDFSYKKSPFQNRDALILGARLALERRLPEDICGETEGHRRDREERGQYRFPSAGSAFKNNRAFGKPTGKIIDELGLRGFSMGGAAVAPFHGNFIINTGNAASSDIRALTGELAARVKAALGFELEPEILFVGDW